MPVSITTQAARGPWQSVLDALNNNDLLVVVAFACFGLMVSLVLLQNEPFSNEIAAFLSQAS
jgi:hypothetical protein